MGVIFANLLPPGNYRLKISDIFYRGMQLAVNRNSFSRIVVIFRVNTKDEQVRHCRQAAFFTRKRLPGKGAEITAG